MACDWVWMCVWNYDGLGLGLDERGIMMVWVWN